MTPLIAVSAVLAAAFLFGFGFAAGALWAFTKAAEAIRDAWSWEG